MERGREMHRDRAEIQPVSEDARDRTHANARSLPQPSEDPAPGAVAVRGAKALLYAGKSRLTRPAPCGYELRIGVVRALAGFDCKGQASKTAGWPRARQDSHGGALVVAHRHTQDGVGLVTRVLVVLLPPSKKTIARSTEHTETRH